MLFYIHIELDNPGIMISCTCICDTGGQGIQKRGVITCNDCFKIGESKVYCHTYWIYSYMHIFIYTTDDINIRINAGM